MPLESAFAVIVLLPVVAIIFSVFSGLSYQDAAIVVIVAEAVLRGGYFGGLLVRFVSTASARSDALLTFSKSRRDTKVRDNDGHTAPSTEAGKGP